MINVSDVIRVLSEVQRGLSDPNDICIDQGLGYAQYLVLLLNTSNDNKTRIIHNIMTLRSGALTAFSSLNNPIHQDEKYKWTTRLVDTISDVGSINPQRNTETKNKIEAPRDFKEQLKMFGALLSNEVKDNVKDGIKRKDNTAPRTDANGTYYSELMDGTDADHAICYAPVVLTGSRINNLDKKRMLEMGMNISSMHTYYTVINNCRVLGIKSNIIPGDRKLANRVLSTILNDCYTNGITRYVISKAPMRCKGEHSYFMLLPDNLNISFQNWDFAAVKK